MGQIHSHPNFRYRKNKPSSLALGHMFSGYAEAENAGSMVCKHRLIPLQHRRYMREFSHYLGQTSSIRARCLKIVSAIDCGHGNIAFATILELGDELVDLLLRFPLVCNTKKFASLMIRFPAYNFERAVDLFRQHQADELMGKRDAAEAEFEVGAAEDRVGETETAADDEADTAAAVSGELVQVRGQLLGRP